MPSKPMSNYRTGQGELKSKDLFQTPSYALEPLLPYLSRFSRVWEPAAGEGYLARALKRAGKMVFADDLQIGGNRFAQSAPNGVEVEVTNVPFGAKYDWLRRATAQGLPFALLMPSDVLWAGSKFRPLMERYGLQMLVPDKRINFKTPIMGWVGENGQKSSAQVHTSWVTWQLELPKMITFCKILPKEEEPLADEDRVCGSQVEMAKALMERERAEKTARSSAKAGRAA